MRHFTWIDFIVSPLETKPPNLIIFQLHPNLLLSNAIKSVLILKCLNVDVDSTNSTFKSVKDKKKQKIEVFAVPPAAHKVQAPTYLA